MNKLVIILIVLFMCCGLQATVIVKATGTLDTVTQQGYEWDDSVNAGTEFSVYYYFDDLTDYGIWDDYGNYNSAEAIVQVGNYQFTSLSGSLIVISEGTSDVGYSFLNNDLEGDGTIYKDGEPVNINSIDWDYKYSWLVLQTTDDENIASDEFPLIFPDINIFDDENYFKVEFRKSDISAYLFLQGHVTSIEVIPEPCTVVLLGVGGLLALRRCSGQVFGRRKKS